MLNYKNPRYWVLVVAVIAVIAVGTGLLSNPKTSTISDVADNFSPEALERVAYGTFVSGTKVLDLSTEKTIDVSDFIKELQVSKKEVSKDRGEGRVSTNQIHLAFEGFGNDGSIYNIYFNFNTDFTEVWVDNGVKPSFSYRVKKPDSVKNFFEQQFESTTTPIEIGSAEELWKARTKYIGDNSAVGALIGLLPTPKDLQFDHFKLHTGVRPYVVEIVYSTSTEKLKHYDKDEKYIANPFGNNALLLLALIDNADQISASITDGKLKKEFINVREWAEDTVGRDVRDYTESPEKLQELIDLSFASTASDVRNVKREVAASKVYHEKDIIDAMDTVERYFQSNFEGCTLTDLWYEESASVPASEGWAKQYDADESIVLLSNFDVDSSGGDGSFNPNDTYTNWQWILVRNKGSEWELKTWGY